MFSINGVLYSPQTIGHGVALIKAPRKRSPSPGQLNLLDGTRYAAPPPKAMRVGQRKVDDQGRIYELNHNRRWSRVAEHMKQPAVGGLSIINSDAEGGLRSRRATTWSGAPEDPTPRPRYSDYARRPYIPKISNEGELRPREELIVDAEAVVPEVVDAPMPSKSNRLTRLLDELKQNQAEDARNAGQIYATAVDAVNTMSRARSKDGEIPPQVELDLKPSSPPAPVKRRGSPRQQVQQLLDELKANRESDIRNAAQIYGIAQGATEAADAEIKRRSLPALKGELRPREDPGEELESLFLDADRIGNKYQSEEERAEFQEQLNQEVEAIADATDRLFPDEPGPAPVATPTPRRPLPARPNIADPTSKEAIAARLERMRRKPEAIAPDEESPDSPVAFDESAAPVKTKKELQALADEISPIVRGKSGTFVADDGTKYKFVLSGVRVADGGGWKGLVADISSGMRTSPTGKTRPMSSMSDMQTARDFYTAALGLPKDSIRGGAFKEIKNNSGSFIGSTSAGMISLDPGRKVTIDLGRQAVDYPLRAIAPDEGDLRPREDEPESVEVEVAQEVKKPGLVADLKNLVTELKESRAEKIKAISGIMGASTKLAQNYDKLVDEISDMVHEDLGVPREVSESTPVTVRAGGNTDTPEPPKPLGDRIRAIASQLREEQSTQARGVSRVLGAAAEIAGKYDALVDEAAAMARADLDAKAIAATPEQGPLRLRESDGPKDGDRKTEGVSRKQVQSHISSKLNLKHFDLDVFTVDAGKGLRIVGRGGIDKTFSSNRAAKAWITKLDNQELYRRVDARLSPRDGDRK